jgi:hypothetical protein
LGWGENIKKEFVSEREKIPSMITVSNEALIAEMIGRSNKRNMFLYIFQAEPMSRINGSTKSDDRSTLKGDVFLFERE